MKLFRNISNVIVGLSMLFAVVACQEEIRSEGQAVLTDKTVLTFEAQNAQEQIIPLKADGKWTAEVSVDWLTISPMSGNGHTDVVVTVTDNVKNGAQKEPRKGTIRFSAGDGRNYGYLSYATCTVTVNQKGDNYIDVLTETTVTETAALWDYEAAKVRGSQVVAVSDEGFVISDGTTNMFVKSAAEVKVGDMLYLNGMMVPVNSLPSFEGDEVTVLSNSEVVYPTAKEITAELDTYKAEKVELVKVTGTLVGNQLLGIAGDPSKGVAVVPATKALGLEKVAVHNVEITGYWLGLQEDAHLIAIASYEDLGENLDICAEFPYRDDFSWLQPFVEEAKTKVAENKWPIDAVGQNVNTGTNLPNLYTDIKSCLAEFQNRGYQDYMPEYKSIYLADGYLKYSISKKPTGIVLPLIAIPGTQDIYVQFNWCAEKNGSGVIDDVKLVVEIDGPGSFEKPSSGNPKVSENIVTTQVAEQLEWQYASVRINGATMGTKISIHPVETAGMRRYFLDNLAVVSLADASPANVVIEGPKDNIFKFEGAPAEPQSFSVTSDKEFFVTSSANWVKLDVAGGKAYEKTVVNVSCDPSELSTLRDAYITVSSGATKQQLIVIQSAAGIELAPFISVIGGNSTLVEEGEGEIDVQIQSNVAYSVEVVEGAEWLQHVPAPITKALVEVTSNKFSVAANTVSQQRTAKVRFYNEEQSLETFFTVNQKAKTSFEDFVIWQLDQNIKETLATTFNTTGGAEGDGGAYVDATYGNGRITYYQADKTGFDVKDSNIYRQMNDELDLVCKGNWVGDYWLFTSSRDGKATIPAGSQFEFKFSTRISSAAPFLWIVEYLDGTEWKPAMETSVKTVDGKEVVYNIEYSNTDVLNHECFITTSVAMPEFKVRIVAAVAARYNGTIDAKPSGGNHRIKGADLSPRIRAIFN